MTVIKKAIVKSYDAAAHKATVQIAGSLGVWLDGIRVATDIPAADVVAGRQCTVLFLDPSNQDDAVVVTIQGHLPSGGGGGSSTFIGLTDTPGSYSGEALKVARVNAGETALEFFDILGAANTWSALQTFGADIKLAAGKTVKDSGGTDRYKPQTSTPHNILYGDTHVEDYLEIASSRGGIDSHLWICPTRTGVTGGVRGVTVSPDVSTVGNTRACTGVFGQARLSPAAATVGHDLYGLNFTAIAKGGGAGTVINRLFGLNAGFITLAYTGTITSAYTHRNAQAVLVGGDITTYYNQHNQGLTIVSGTLQDAYGLKQDDITGASGFCRLLEIGPPYLRVVGGGNPGANQTNVYIQEQATLRRVQWKDGAAVGAGDKVMVLV